MKKSIFLLLAAFSLFSYCDVLKIPIPTSTPIPTPIPTINKGHAQFEKWIHSPLHPSDYQSVNFKLKANDQEGIQKVELLLFEYELFTNAEGLPSKRRNPQGTWGIIKTWNFSTQQDTADLNFLYKKGFAAKSNVVYQFKIYNAANEVSSEWAMFDAGTSPWPQDKILLYTNSDHALKNSINICFLSDIDYKGNRPAFLKDIEQLIFEGYHINNMIAANKDKWAFYYTQQEADGMAIISDYNNEANYPAFMRDSIIQGIDAFALIHQNVYSDGALLRGNIAFLVNNMFTSEAFNFGTAIHETAHAVFGLSDEYEGCACFEGAAGSNMFLSLAACESFNAKKSFPTGECSALTNYNGETWYMSEHSALFSSKEDCEKFNQQRGYDKGTCGLFIDIDGRERYRSEQAVCIMQDDGDRIVRKFQKTCGAIISDVYKKMSQQSLPGNFVGLQRVDNIFGYEPVINLGLSLNNGDMDLKLSSIKYGIPTKTFLPSEEINLKAINNKGQAIDALTLNQPGKIIIHRDGQADIISINQQAKCQVALAYKEEISKINCELSSVNNLNLEQLSKPISKAFNVRKVLKRQYLKFRGN